MRNLQEGRHDLARTMFHGRKGELRHGYREGIEDQLGALGLILNTITLWNTVYLSQPDLAARTRAKYRQTLTVVEGELGDARVTGAALAAVIAQRWHHASPATWNRQLATVRSVARYCTRTRVLEVDGEIALQRRSEKHDDTRSIPLARPGPALGAPRPRLRERTLWRVLYETAARAEEVLRLDIGDLDVPAKRARTRSEGGDIDWLLFGSGSARRCHA